MTEIYGKAYSDALKKRVTLRATLLVVLFVGVVCLYIYTVAGPHLLWLSLLAGIGGAILLCTVWAAALSAPVAELKLFNEAQIGIKNTDELIFNAAGKPGRYEGMNFDTAVFTGKGEKGAYERTLYVRPGSFSAQPGARVTVQTYKSMLIAYKVTEE